MRAIRRTTAGTSYAYDAANRLKTASGGNSYEYDGDGRRVKQTNSAGTVFYLWSSVLNQPVAEIDGAYGSVFRAYVFGAGGQTLAMQSYDGNFYWVHSDHLGSGRKLTNTSGVVVYRGEYDPHGQMILETGGATFLNSRKFTGYERDWATGLDYARARTYQSARGKFMQADPLGLGAADVTNPQSLNLYSYVGNDPINFVDPTGLMCYARFEVTTQYENGEVVGETWELIGIFCYGGGGGGTVGGGGSSSSTGQDANSFLSQYDLGKLIPCLLDAGVNLGVGVFLGMLGPLGGLAKGLLDLTGTDINLFQKAAGVDNAIDPYGGTDLVAGYSSLASAGAQQAYKGKGGDVALDRAKDLVNRSSFQKASPHTQAKRLGDLSKLAKYKAAARFLPGLAQVATLIDFGSDAYKCFEKSEKKK